jgi:hypothetical protein
MKQKIFYLFLFLALAGTKGFAQEEVVDPITLTIELNTELPLTGLTEAYSDPYSNINVAIDAAFTALGKTLAAHGQYVKELILTGTAPYS